MFAIFVYKTLSLVRDEETGKPCLWRDMQQCERYFYSEKIEGIILGLPASQLPSTTEYTYYG